MTKDDSAACSRIVVHRIMIEKHQVSDLELSKPVNELLDKEIPGLYSIHAVTEWHTPITGLFRIARDKQRIWITGVDGAIRQLEARPFDVSLVPPKI